MNNNIKNINNKEIQCFNCDTITHILGMILVGIIIYTSSKWLK